MLRTILFIVSFILSTYISGQVPKTAKNSSSKPPVQKQEYDTAYKGWLQYRSEEIDRVFIDKKDNLYAKIKTSDGLRIMKLVNDKWLDIQGNIKDNYCHLITDPQGGVYLISEKIGYRQTAKGWEKAWDQGELTGLGFGLDGKLYGYFKPVIKPEEQPVVVYEKGNWVYCGKEKFPSNNTYRSIDRFGNVYMAYNLNPTGMQVFDIKKWDGKTWTILADNIGQVKFMDIDEKGDLYIQVFESNVFRLRKWDPAMQSWKSVAIPQNLHGWNFITRLRNGQLQLCGDQVDEGNLLLYRFVNNSWLLEAKWKKEKGFDEFDEIFLPVGNNIYTTANKRLYKFDKSPIITSRSVTSVQPIPLVGVNTEIPEIAALYGKMGIFIENGKKGIKDKNGKVIIHPLFDQISIEKAPKKYWSQEKYNYAFRLKNESDNFLCAYADIGPGKLYGFIDTLVRCLECGGKGEIKDRIEKVLVPGEYVPEKKTTTSKTVPVTTLERVWNSQTNQYDNVRRTTNKVIENTTTEKAYRKKDTYRNEVIKGGTCKVCKGWSLKITRNDYEYNLILKKYKLKQTEYKDYNID